MFPCAISTDSRYILHRLHLTHVNLFLQPICTPYKPCHSSPPSLTVLCSSRTADTCTSWWMVDLCSREPCPPAFFPPKSEENPRKLVLPLSYSKANKHPTPPANPNQASPKDPLLHLQVAATCGIRCWELCCSLFLLSTALATWTPAGRNCGPHTSWWTVPVVNNHVLLIMDHELNTFPLGAVKVEEVSGLALPSI